MEQEREEENCVGGRYERLSVKMLLGLAVHLQLQMQASVFVG